MSNIFTLDKFDDFSEKINIDELYEGKRQLDINKLELFKKILNRVHIRIKSISRQRGADKCCWYVVPEIMIGVPRYDHAGCIAYIMTTLDTNGFKVKYFQPNTIFITWNHWVPSYVRTEIKKKTGILVNEFGEKIEHDDNVDELEDIQLHNKPIDAVESGKGDKKYTPITSYKPSGKLVYNEEILNRIDNKMRNK